MDSNTGKVKRQKVFCPNGRYQTKEKAWKEQRSKKYLKWGGPGSNPKHSIFAFINLYYWNCKEKRTIISKKRPWLAHFKKYVYKNGKHCFLSYLKSCQSMYLVAVFSGLSGDNFSFDSNGDGPSRYNIIHYKQVTPGQYHWVNVGFFHNDEVELNMDGEWGQAIELFSGRSVSVTRFGEISPLWQKVTSLWQNFDGLFLISQNAEPALAIFSVANGQILKNNLVTLKEMKACIKL